MRAFALLISLTLSTSAYAASYQLFMPVRDGINQAAPVDFYDRIMQRLSPGDRVIFSGGESYVLKEFLGEGNTTRIFSLGNGKAIRIPKNYKMTEKTFNTYDINMFIDGYAELSREGVRTAQVFLDESRRDEYAIVEQVTKQFDLAEYLHGSIHFEPSEMKRIKSDLIEFAKSTANFIQIADFHSKNIVFTRERGWILMDWFSPNLPLRVSPTTSHTVFDGKFKDNKFWRPRPISLPLILGYQIRSAVRKSRTNQVICRDLF